MAVVLFALNKLETQPKESPTKTTSFEPYASSKEVVPFTDNTTLFYPTSTTGVVVKHNYFALSYSEKYEQAEWVAYVLKPEHLTGDKRTRPNFKQDPNIDTQSANLSNYKKSGYTRGHLLPAGDRVFSKQAYDETFYTSNISPQLFEFNAGIWNSLEVRVRNFVKKNGEVFVVTGGVLNDELKTIGNEKVAVPKYFYKIILFKDNQKYKMVAYLIPHNKIKKQNYSDFSVTTDSIEKLTGIDFFYSLEPTIQEQLESSIDTHWFE
jgi:endonuclease G